MFKRTLGLLIAVSAPMLALFSPQTVRAQQTGQQWVIASDHPDDTVGGSAIRQFSVSLSERTGDAVSGIIRTKSKPKFEELIEEIQQGRLQVVDVFSGSLVRLDPIFELPTLPFIVRSASDAHQLACIALPAYRSALSKAGFHLLFISPWPPTGLWSREPVDSEADIAALKVRTYDEASAEVLQAIGVQAVALPIHEVAPRLRIGSLNAVLSSGDGAVGKLLAKDLPNFSAIGYAYPTSFVLMKASVYKALPKRLRDQVDAAATDVSEQQWNAFPQRIRSNYERMKYAGVTVAMSPTGAMESRLADASRDRVESWLSRVPASYAEIIKSLHDAKAKAVTDACTSKFDSLKVQKTAPYAASVTASRDAVSALY
ncbi:TRAP transporter substrate-binding protein DctP [Trinickia sp. NRRL B-1857]|uniref:TRAP transporter substrate-binding protein DctP n=1 Tax=Trinickia sp. NRRL B-1857 TaxID=3162879 RepID=UPI003D2DAF42